MAVLFADPLMRSSGTAERARAAPPADPCGLRQLQPVGLDTRCSFALSAGAGRPFTVDLEQRWEGNVLTQWLNIRDGGPDAAHFLFARGAGPRPMRVQQLFPVSVPGGNEHLAYLVGLCGAPSCGTAEIWIVGVSDDHIVPLLKLTLGQAAQVALGADGAVVVSETAERLGSGMQLIRTLRWDDGRYRVEQTARERRGPR